MTFTRWDVPPSDNIGVALTGQVCYRAQSGDLPLGLAVQNNDGILTPADLVSGRVDGVLIEPNLYITRGPVSLADWTAATGGIELSEHMPYYLRDDGTLSVIPPEIGWFILVGRAQSASVLDVTFELRVFT